MSAEFFPTKVEPIGNQRSAAFVSYEDGRCGFDTHALPVYPPSPNGDLLRNARIVNEWSLRAFAARAGLRVVQLSELERGAATLTGPEWKRLIALAEEASR